VAICVTVRVAVGDGDSDALALALAEALALVEALALPEALPVPLGEGLGVCVLVAPGENEVGGVEGADPEQAVTAAEESMIMVPQPMTVNLALSPVPAMVVGTFIESSCPRRPKANSLKAPLALPVKTPGMT
jgi:hypothetical protein